MRLLGDKPRLSLPTLPALNRLQSACALVHQQWPDVAIPPDKDQETIVRDMASRVQNWDWQQTSVMQVIRAGRLAFEPEFRDRLQFRHLRRFFYAETRESTHQAFLGAMLSIYLATYEPNAIHSKELGLALTDSQTRLGAQWSKLLSSTPFLFDPEIAHLRLGSAMNRMPDIWSGLQSRGFRNPHSPGILQHSHQVFVKEAKNSLSSLHQVERMLAWLKPTERNNVLESGAEIAIEALLVHWIHDEPPSELRNRLLDELVSNYQDPRVRTGGVWARVREQYKDVLFRWLTGANIEFFLDVVSEVNESHMWPERRKFWLRLYKEGRIHNAWVAFSPRAAKFAQREAAKTHSSGASLEYGTQIALGTRSTTSLLILHIGKCILVEGSHNYKVQFFRHGDPKAPKLFQDEYDCEDIRLTEKLGQVTHIPKSWQNRVEEFLAAWA